MSSGSPNNQIKMLSPRTYLSAIEETTAPRRQGIGQRQHVWVHVAINPQGRAHDVRPQLRSNKRITARNFTDFLELFRAKLLR